MYVERSEDMLRRREGVLYGFHMALTKLLCNCELDRIPQITRAITVCLILIAFNGCVTSSSGGLTVQLRRCRPCETCHVNRTKEGYY